MENKLGGIPLEPPLDLPSPPGMSKMGKKTDLAMSFKTSEDKDLEQFRREARTERDVREARLDPLFIPTVALVRCYPLLVFDSIFELC